MEKDIPADRSLRKTTPRDPAPAESVTPPPVSQIRIPTVAGDRVLASWHDVRWGEMVIHLECEFAEPLDERRLARACELAIIAEPLLGCRFVSSRFRHWWESTNGAGAAALEITQDPSRWHEFPRRDFDPRSGPQFKALLFRESSGDHVMFRVSHLIADAGATKEVVAIVSEIYRKLGQNPHYMPEPRQRGSRSLWQVFHALPLRAHFRVLRNFLRISRQNRTVAHRVDLPLRTRTPFTWVHRQIDRDHVSSLMDWARARSATLNDMMIAAFLKAIARATADEGPAHHRFQMTVDLRRYLPGGCADGICNLSSFDYLDMGTAPLGSFEDVLTGVTAITAQRKRDWLGLLDFVLVPILRFLSLRASARLFASMLEHGNRRRWSPNGMTNMGRIAPEVVDFDGAPRLARLLTPVVYPPMLGCGMSSYGGTLTLTSGVPVSVQPEVDRFLDAVVAELPPPCG